jgi:EamA domain-containing membrane protein RarD
MRLPTAIIGGVLIGLAGLALLWSSVVSFSRSADGLSSTCWKYASVPLGIGVDDSGELAIEGESLLPLGINCVFHMQDGTDRVEFIDVATAPTVAAVLLGAAGAIVFVVLFRIRNRIPTNGRNIEGSG